MGCRRKLVDRENLVFFDSYIIVNQSLSKDRFKIEFNIEIRMIILWIILDIEWII